MKAVDLFAGPGGWDEGVRPLGFAPLGIELDEAACQTREAAGHPTIRADVAALDPADFAPCDMLIASPPCQAFSAAGKGEGHLDVPAIARVADGLDRGEDLRAGVSLHDRRSLLVVEPLRWALALRPTFVALEQVPPVLDLWRHFARILERHGYRTWAGLLSAERYGVPQTRERAFLMASLAGPVHPPAPTHQEYRPGEPACEQHTLEGVLLPWVSMAEALGWGLTERPTTTVTAGNGRQGGHDPLDGGSGSRAVTLREREREERGGRAFRLHRGAGMNERHGERPDTPDTEPAPTITSKARTARWYRNGNQERAALRHESDPEPTVHFRRALNDVRWVWPLASPATTVAGDPRLTSRSHHEHGEQGREQVEDGTYDGRSAVRVTLQEAAILQGFPADYPFQGSRTKRFEQVGNAVPPPLARAVIQALLASSPDRGPGSLTEGAEQSVSPQ